MKLIIRSLKKKYPDGTNALDNISLEIGVGMFGLLGPNGAGKSTLMRVLATVQQPDSGGVFLDELDILSDQLAFRKRLGYLPQDFGFYPNISVEDLLLHVAELKGVAGRTLRKELVADVLNHVNLFAQRKKMIGSLSGGMRQRVGIGQALLGNPRVIIVDEPTAGLDPAERNNFYNVLGGISEDMIVILSTHLVEDISALCSEFAIIRTGKIEFAGSPDQAMALLRGRVFVQQIPFEQYSDFSRRFRVISTYVHRGKFFVRAVGEDLDVWGFDITEPSMEDFYFAVIGSHLKLI